MRTDATIDRKQVICPNASTLGYGKYKAQTGDFIVYREHYTDGNEGRRFGRVIGHIDYAPALDGDSKATRNRLVVIALADMPTFCFERWIDPDDVIEILADKGQINKMLLLLNWFLSPELPKYPVNELREWAGTGFPNWQQWSDYKNTR